MTLQNCEMQNSLKNREAQYTGVLKYVCFVLQQINFIITCSGETSPILARSSDAKNRQTVVKESASCRTIVSCNHLPVFPISYLLVTLRCSLNWSSLTLGSLLESRPSQSHSRRMVRAEASFSDRFACLVGWTGWVEKNSRSSKSWKQEWKFPLIWSLLPLHNITPSIPRMLGLPSHRSRPWQRIEGRPEIKMLLRF